MLHESAQLADLARRLANLIRPGLIAEADYARARVRVRAGELLTDWLPWLTHRAGGDVTWWAPEVGEQVLILSPDGEPAQAWVLPAGFSQAAAAPANRETVHVTRYQDGAVIQYDREAHKLTATIPGDVELTATGSVTCTATGAVAATSEASITLTAPTVTIVGSQSIGLVTPALTMSGQRGGKTRARLQGDIRLEGTLDQQGDQTVQGSIRASGDIMAAGQSDNHHTH